MEQWIKFDNVAIFDSHDGAEEDLPFVFDAAKLQQLIDNTNKRILDTGDLVPLYPGHASIEETLEVDAVLLGFAENFRLGILGNVDPRPAIFADLKVFADKAEIARNLPRRSAEIWLTKNAPDPLAESAIDVVSLLGPTTPARFLGLTFSRRKSKGETHTYSQEPIVGGVLENDQVIQEVLKALESSDVFQWCKAQMANEAKAEDVAQDKAEFAADEDAAKKEDAKEYKDDPTAGDDKPEKLKLQRDQERRRYSKLEGEYKLLSGRLADMERSHRIAERKSDLLGLEGEGLVFEMADEMDLVSEMEPVRYSRHLTTMRKNYMRTVPKMGVEIKMPEQTLADVDLLETNPHTANVRARQAADLVSSGKAKNAKEALSMLRNN